MLVTLLNTAKHATASTPNCNHELAQLRLSQCRNYLPCGLGGRLPDGNAPPRDGGAAGKLAQLDVGAHRPYKPHRVAEFPAPREDGVGRREGMRREVAGVGEEGGGSARGREAVGAGEEGGGTRGREVAGAGEGGGGGARGRGAVGARGREGRGAVKEGRHAVEGCRRRGGRRRRRWSHWSGCGR